MEKDRSLGLRRKKKKRITMKEEKAEGNVQMKKRMKKNWRFHRKENQR